MAKETRVKAKKKAPAKKKYAHIHIRPADNGGHIINVHYPESPAATKNADRFAMPEPPEETVHPDGNAAMQHIAPLLGATAPSADDRAGKTTPAAGEQGAENEDEE